MDVHPGKALRFVATGASSDTAAWLEACRGTAAPGPLDRGLATPRTLFYLLKKKLARDAVEAADFVYPGRADFGLHRFCSFLDGMGAAGPHSTPVEESSSKRVASTHVEAMLNL